MAMDTRVVVTGMSVVTPLGNDVPTYWRALCEGKSGIRVVDRFDTEKMPSRIAGMAEDAAPADMGKKELRRLRRYALFSLYLGEEAWRDAGLSLDRENPFRCGVFMGSGVGTFRAVGEAEVALHEKGPRRVSPLAIPQCLISIAAGHIAIRLGLMGPNKSIATACASATQNIGAAADLIRLDKADVMLAGGAETAVNPLGMSCFGAMRVLSTRNGEPERASRPFDADRDGFVIGEGGGMLVLESEAHARSRGAEILAEVAGLGETSDAYHMVAPHPDGAGAAEAMRAAFRQARVSPGEVDYVNPHGTSTVLNDASESLALRAVFGDTMPPVSSTKSMIGHLLGGAGAVEAVACIMSIRDGILHPSINYETPDPDCAVNLVANEARELKVAITASNSLGFGGHNACLVLRRYECA